MNRVILVGRITKEPELKYTNSNVPYVQFSLAINRTFKDASGERQADFINCVAWRQTAELISRYINKGNQMGVEGRLQTRQYDDPNGLTRYITEVIVETIHFLEPKRQGVGFDDYNQPQPTYQQPTYQQQAPFQQQPSYQQQYQSPYNAQQKPVTNQQEVAPKQESPFDTSNMSHDISDDDLPF